MPTDANPTITHNAERLLTALQTHSTFIKDKQNTIEKVELDYHTFIQLQELLSQLKIQDKPKETTPRTLYDACMQNNDFGDDDFDDIDFSQFDEVFVPEKLF